MWYRHAMARRTAAQAERTRESLVEAGVTLFANTGFDGVSAEEISSCASVTRGALYHHFDGKLGLFREVVRRVFESQGESILEAAATEAEPWEALLSGCIAFLRHSLGREYRQIVMLDAPSVLGIDEWHALDREYTSAPLQQALAEMLGATRDADLEALTEALSGSMNQLSIWAGAEGSIDRAEAMVRRLLEAMVL